MRHIRSIVLFLPLLLSTSLFYSSLLLPLFEHPPPPPLPPTFSCAPNPNANWEPDSEHHLLNAYALHKLTEPRSPSSQKKLGEMVNKHR